MAEIRGFEIPEERHYLIEKHVWVQKMGDGVVRLGLTPVAYRLMRYSLVAISIQEKALGREVAKGKSIAMVESLKFIGPLPAPFAGVVLRANEALIADPEQAEKDPYGAGWIAEMRPSSAADIDELPTGEAAIAAYRILIEAQNITLQ